MLFGHPTKVVITPHVSGQSTPNEVIVLEYFPLLVTPPIHLFIWPSVLS